MERVRTALVGCGKVGQIHAAALQALPESEFVAVRDHDPGRAAAFAARYGATAYADVDTPLREPRPESVVVATPHPLHVAPAVRAAEAGAHVLVEKPLAASLADCDAMLEEGCAVVVLFTTVYRSGRERRPVELPLVHEG
jgi:UDP-N-acetyl-2-amino-2-deoxyglucuronate dehydrogenase